MGIITCYIWGGLGQQLFQIIATYAYALDYNYIPIFDITQKKSGNQLDPINFYWDNVFKKIRFLQELKIVFFGLHQNKI